MFPPVALFFAFWATTVRRWLVSHGLTIVATTYQMQSARKRDKVGGEDTGLCDLWAGKFPLGMPQRVDFVVAYCKVSLRDVNTFITEVRGWGVTVGTIDVYSKCGGTPDLLPPGATLHLLRNLGGNDHTYAYHMAKLTSKNNLAYDGVVVFIKDHLFNKHQVHNMQGNISQSILKAAGPAGFGCFLDPQPGTSVFANTTALGAFTFSRGKGTPYRDLSSWLRKALKADLPTPVTPVCYGGNFAAKVRNIQRNAHFWPALTRSLERDIIPEECHFAERSWAGLLMSVSQSDLRRVRCAATRSFDNLRKGYVGILQDCKPSEC